MSLLAKPKRRGEILRQLDHFQHFDHRYLSTLSSHMHERSMVLAELVRRGASEFCWVISADRAIDGRKMKLRETLDAIFGKSIGALLSCVPGRLAYYEGEEPGERYILDRT